MMCNMDPIFTMLHMAVIFEPCIYCKLMAFTISQTCLAFLYPDMGTCDQCCFVHIIHIEEVQQTQCNTYEANLQRRLY